MILTYDDTAKYQELDRAIGLDAYEYLLTQAPGYLKAVKSSLDKGATPDEIRQYMSRQLGPERQALALRCSQAASYLYFLNERSQLQQVHNKG